jgi:hypothetical protein
VVPVVILSGFLLYPLGSRWRKQALKDLRRPGQRLPLLHTAALRVPKWLIKDYVDYLISGGQPIAPSAAEAPGSSALAALAQHGGSFEWLADEPDLYSADDGELI